MRRKLPTSKSTERIPTPNTASTDSSIVSNSSSTNNHKKSLMSRIKNHKKYLLIFLALYMIYYFYIPPGAYNPYFLAKKTYANYQVDRFLDDSSEFLSSVGATEIKTYKRHFCRKSINRDYKSRAGYVYLCGIVNGVSAKLPKEVQESDEFARKASEWCGGEYIDMDNVCGSYHIFEFLSASSISTNSILFLDTNNSEYNEDYLIITQSNNGGHYYYSRPDFRNIF